MKVVIAGGSAAGLFAALLLARAAQALALDALVGVHIAPYYEDQAAIAQLRRAAAVDPAAFRAFWKVMGMMCPPEEVYTDPAVVACTHEVLKQRDVPRPVQPSRERLLAALAGPD